MPFAPMSIRLFASLAAFAALFLPGLLPAQTADSTASEDERLEALARASAEWYVPQTTVQVGFRILSSGANVSFRNLGIIGYHQSAIAYTEGAVTRVYDNGQVTKDSLRSTEMDSDGNQTSNPGGRYKTYIANIDPSDPDVTKQIFTQNGDYLSYTPGLTRSWSYGTAAQTATPGYVSFSSYAASTDGSSLAHKQGPSGGIDFQVSRSLSRASQRLQWGLIAGISLNDINSKIAGAVSATLRTTTDYFSLNGLTATPLPESGAASNPTYNALYDASGNLLSSLGLETTVPLSAVPDASLSGKETTAVGGATVTGRWQLKGSYFMVRVGPSLHTQLTEHLGVSASAGIAGAYAGTHYTAFESMQIPDLPADQTLSVTEESDTSKFLGGYFADLNFDWAANERTGLFGGITAQKFDGYDQTLGGRTARVDLGNSVGLRGGISIKF